MERYEAMRIDTGEEPEKIVMVSSKRCRYTVSFDEDDGVSIFGPGVSESSERLEPEFDSLEDAGIFYIILFESGLWPE